MKKKLGMTFSLVSGEEEVAEVVEKLRQDGGFNGGGEVRAPPWLGREREVFGCRRSEREGGWEGFRGVVVLGLTCGVCGRHVAFMCCVFDTYSTCQTRKLRILARILRTSPNPEVPR